MKILFTFTTTSQATARNLDSLGDGQVAAGGQDVAHNVSSHALSHARFSQTSAPGFTTCEDIDAAATKNDADQTNVVASMSYVRRAPNRVPSVNPNATRLQGSKSGSAVRPSPKDLLCTLQLR